MPSSVRPERAFDWSLKKQSVSFIPDIWRVHLHLKSANEFIIRGPEVYATVMHVKLCPVGPSLRIHSQHLPQHHINPSLLKQAPSFARNSRDIKVKVYT